MKNNKKIGLALSGGGYRAAAFHLGVFSKLNKLNLLEHIDVISTISGGSIAGAYFLLNKDDYSKFELNFIKALQKSVIKKILFSRRIIITQVSGLKCK
jgi:NTE family protein